MSNKWKTRRKITYTCAFAGVAVLVACIFCAPPAAGVLFTSATSATASDYMFGSDSLSWGASNGIANAVPLVPGQEEVTGSGGTHFHSQGPATFDSQKVLDTRSIIQYQSEKQVKWDKLGILSDTVAMTGMTAPLDIANSWCYQGENVTATNERATQWALTIGGNGEYHGLNTITQVDDTIPDTLDTQMVITGKGGSGTIGFSSQSLIGFANTTRPMWTFGVDQKITGGGATYSIGKATKWRSFSTIFNSTFEEQTAPAE